MSKLDEATKKFDKALEEGLDDRIDDLKEDCICETCPSYAGTGETRLLFCGTDISDTITEEQGCTCGICPVYQKLGLTRNYFCTRGPEASQREAAG
jgi:hypothetical protein